MAQTPDESSAPTLGPDLPGAVHTEQLCISEWSNSHRGSDSVASTPRQSPRESSMGRAFEEALERPPRRTASCELLGTWTKENYLFSPPRHQKPAPAVSGSSRYTPTPSMSSTSHASQTPSHRGHLLAVDRMVEALLSHQSFQKIHEAAAAAERAAQEAASAAAEVRSCREILAELLAVQKASVLLNWRSAVNAASQGGNQDFPHSDEALSPNRHISASNSPQYVSVTTPDRSFVASLAANAMLPSQAVAAPVQLADTLSLLQMHLPGMVAQDASPHAASQPQTTTPILNFRQLEHEIINHLMASRNLNRSRSSSRSSPAPSSSEENIQVEALEEHPPEGRLPGVLEEELPAQESRQNSITSAEQVTPAGPQAADQVASGLGQMNLGSIIPAISSSLQPVLPSSTPPGSSFVPQSAARVGVLSSSPATPLFQGRPTPQSSPAGNGNTTGGMGRYLLATPAGGRVLPVSQRLCESSPKLLGLWTVLKTAGKGTTHLVGLVPWSGENEGPKMWGSRVYQYGALAMTTAAASWLVADAVLVGRQNFGEGQAFERAQYNSGAISLAGFIVQTMFGPVSRAILGVGAMGALASSGILSGSKELLQVNCCLDEYSRQQMYEDGIVKTAGCDLIMLKLFFMVIVVVQYLDFNPVTRGYVDSGEVLEGTNHWISLAVNVCVSFVILSHTFYLLQVCNKLKGMVENFCIRVAEHRDFAASVKEWNVQQALVRKACISIEHSVAVLILVVMSVTPITLLQASVQGFSPSIFHRLLLVAMVALILARGASVTDMCNRVPALVNAIAVENHQIMDKDRQYAVQYISSSRAGFFAFETLVGTDTVLKLAYVSCLLLVNIVAAVLIRR